jgi:hypothetical protein
MRFTVPNLKRRHLNKKTEWHRWFAWHPVKVDGELWVWGETILRRGIPGLHTIVGGASGMSLALAISQGFKPRYLNDRIAFGYGDEVVVEKEVVRIVDWQYAPARKEG